MKLRWAVATMVSMTAGIVGIRGGAGHGASPWPQAQPQAQPEAAPAPWPQAQQPQAAAQSPLAASTAAGGSNRRGRRRNSRRSNNPARTRGRRNRSTSRCRLAWRSSSSCAPRWKKRGGMIKAAGERKEKAVTEEALRSVQRLRGGRSQDDQIRRRSGTACGIRPRSSTT